MKKSIFSLSPILSSTSHTCSENPVVAMDSPILQDLPTPGISPLSRLPVEIRVQIWLYLFPRHVIHLHTHTVAAWADHESEDIPKHLGIQP